MTAGVIPMDLDAEEQLAGCVLVFRDAYDRASRYCTSADFYDPQLARIFNAAPKGWAVPRRPFPEPDDLPGWDRWDPWRDRAEVVAREAGVSVEEVERIRDACGGAVERSARRIAELAGRRRLMSTCADVFNRLAGGASVDDVRDLLARVAA